MLTTYERGILQGQRQSALRLLERKFGALTSEVKQRVEALSAEQLDQLFQDFLNSQSLKELHLDN